MKAWFAVFLVLPLAVLFSYFPAASLGGSDGTAASLRVGEEATVNGLTVRNVDVSASLARVQVNGYDYLLPKGMVVKVGRGKTEEFLKLDSIAIPSINIRVYTSTEWADSGCMKYAKDSFSSMNAENTPLHSSGTFVQDSNGYSVYQSKTQSIGSHTFTDFKAVRVACENPENPQVWVAN